MRRFWDSGQDEGDIEARLRAERPEPSNELVDRVTGQIADGQPRRELGKTRTAVAVVFASLVLMSGFGAAAFAAGGGNGGNGGNGEQWHSGRLRRGPGAGHRSEPELLNADGEQARSTRGLRVVRRCPKSAEQNDSWASRSLKQIG